MDNELKSIVTMLRLVRCTLHDETPDRDILNDIDPYTLYQVSKKYKMAAYAADALLAAGCTDRHFSSERENALRINEQLEKDTNKLIRKLEHDKIWYIPLTYRPLKDKHPAFMFSQTYSIEFLAEKNKRSKIRDILSDMGYTLNKADSRDVFTNRYGASISVRSELFTSTGNDAVDAYYADIRNILSKDTSNQHGYRFMLEDYYLYLITKLYTERKTELCDLIKIYMILQGFGNSIVWDHMSAVLKQLGLDKIEKEKRDQANRLFRKKEIDHLELSDEIAALAKDHVSTAPPVIGNRFIHIIRKLFR